jgi:NADPH:quinone reductase-like Zn-dependent oxidoreductase
MKQYRITGRSVDSVQQFPMPQPEPGPHEMLVRMRAFSLNYRDLMMAEGRYGAPTPPNLVPLSDGAGEVVAVGAAVRRFKPGDRVASCFFADWDDGELSQAGAASARGGAIDGVLSDYALLNERGAVSVPDDYSFEEAATLPCAALTAWHALVPFGQIAAGSTVLVQGTGGVSVFALQFAHGMGARVICTSSSDAKLERVRALGASDTINYTRTPDWQDEVRRLTGKAGVDLVVEVGGAGTLARSMQAARTGGRIAVIGVLTGRAEVDPTAILFRRLSLQGILVGSRRMFETMNRAIEALSLRPMIDRSFGFDEVPAALNHLKSGGHFGKVVISAE